MSAGVAEVDYPRPTLLTRACLVGAALMPWFSLFSGTYGLYFYVVLAATLLLPWLLIPLLVLAIPLAVLLLLIMPAGVLYAAACGSPQGWIGWLTRVGRFFSMVFALGYGGLMVVIATAPAFAHDASETFDLWLLWRAGLLAVGFGATWRAWSWLRRWSA